MHTLNTSLIFLVQRKHLKSTFTFGTNLKIRTPSPLFSKSPHFELWTFWFDWRCLKSFKKMPGMWRCLANVRYGHGRCPKGVKNITHKESGRVLDRLWKVWGSRRCPQGVLEVTKSFMVLSQSRSNLFFVKLHSKIVYRSQLELNAVWVEKVSEL